MKNKYLNNAVGFILKALLKFYKREEQPYAIQTDVGNVLVNFPKEGGIESWIPNEKFPFPGMPDSRVTGTMDIIKRMFPIIYKWAWVVMRDRLPANMIPQSQNGDIGLVEPSKYSRPVRELHRMFTAIRGKEGEPEMKAKWTEMRDILCLFFEYDDAYRFRLMEAILELDKSQFEFTEADKYWASKKWKYDFNFKKNDTKN